MLWLPLLFSLAQAATPAAARIDTIVQSHRGHWGVYAQRLDTGEILIDRCATCFFTPASVTKLATTALALSRLGPHHRFTTQVRHADGNLYLVGSGDPSLSLRPYPYQPNNDAGAASALESLADAVVARGITTVTGDIIGDDRLWPWRPAPDGWSHDDLTWDFGAPLSALAFADSNLALTILPGLHPGDPARLRLSPAVEYFTIDNRVETIPQGTRQLTLTRAAGSRQLLLSGVIPLHDRGRTEILAVDDPALYAATAFRNALQRRGVSIAGQPRALHRSPGEALAPGHGEIISTRLSPTLAELAQVVNKVSQNLHAEMLLETTGGVEALHRFLEDTLQLRKTEFRLVDGSGLSRLDMLTPHALVRVLAHMKDNREFAATLPIGATDGSLQYRYRSNGPGARVQAKTGGMTGVQTLAGYIDSRSNGRIAFAIFVNNDNGPGAATRQTIDRVVGVLAE